MRLGRNEIMMISLGGVLILGLIFYLFVVSPAIAKEKAFKRNIEKKQADLVNMIALKAEWEKLQRNRIEADSALKKRGRQFTLLSFLEGLSREAGIDGNIQYIKPLSFPEESEDLKRMGMEIKLEDVDLTQLVKFLYKIEYSGKLLNIHRVKIQRMSKEAGLSTLRVTLQVITYARPT